VATALGLLAAGNCQADGILYFDPFAILGWIGLYLLGFIALPIVIYNVQYKLPWIIGLVVYLTAPVAFVIAMAMEKAAKPQPVVEANYKERNAFMAFSVYCHSGKRRVHAIARPAAGDALEIRIGPQFSGDSSEVSAERLHQALLNSPAICAAIAVDTIEDHFATRAYGSTPAGHVTRAFGMCKAGEWHKESGTPARYEIVLGDSGETVTLPEYDARMSSSSVRIRDRITGATLAEDKVYFFDHRSGVQDCPYAMDQVVSLITEVFPRD